ncbi:MAG: zinc ribbon domain-containing protein [Nitrosomonadales bacterium]|nr:zinc ribbon domain-containing protein [Nitrosomonadales bacterium]
MPETYTQCPKCSHPFPQPLPDSEACPACGIYLFKWAQAAGRGAQPTDEAPGQDDLPEREPGWAARLLEPLDAMNEASFYGRCAALLLLAAWSPFLFGYDYRYGEINGSFMHNIILPIHEAGHVLFRPFGEFMTMFGGSLFQILLPLAIGVAFIVKNRDNFGASVLLWWAGASLVDLSPYIYDAWEPQLVLIGGSTGAENGPHDWIYLLGMTGHLGSAQTLGAFVHAIGGLVMLPALVWGGYVLFRQHARLAGRT